MLSTTFNSSAVGPENLDFGINFFFAAQWYGDRGSLTESGRRIQTRVFAA